MLIKVLPLDVYHAVCACTSFRGWRDDERDGFIHLSTPKQLQGTLQKHFTDFDVLALVVFGDEMEGLKWEASRAGALFPHVYGTLDMTARLSVVHLTRDAEGQFHIPEALQL